jgi:hypothetical protein
MQPLIYVQRDLCFVEITEGETDELERQVCESSLVDRLNHSGVSLQSIEINAAGCFVIVPCKDVDRFKAVVRTFNVAIRVHEHCGRIALRHEAPGAAVLPSLAEVIGAFHKQGIRLVHVVADSAEVAVLVNTGEIAPAMVVMDSFSTTTTQRNVA